MVKCYIINGVGGSGKDLFIKNFAGYFESARERNYTINHSTVDLPKEAILALGWDYEDKSDKARVFISEVKDAWKKFNNGPVTESIELVINTIEDVKLHQGDNVIIFIHCREPQEILELKEKISRYCDTKTILIERPFHKGPYCTKDNINIIKSIKYDIHVIAESKEDLETQALKFTHSENLV